MFRARCTTWLATCRNWRIKAQERDGREWRRRRYRRQSQVCLLNLHHAHSYRVLRQSHRLHLAFRITALAFRREIEQRYALICRYPRHLTYDLYVALILRTTTLSSLITQSCHREIHLIIHPFNIVICANISTTSVRSRT
jgi:hypothetical protein